jgi:hypothetical protein
VVFGVQAGIAVVLFPFFQAVLGWSGLLSTVALMPMAVMMMMTSGQEAADTAREGIANAVEAAGSTGPHAQDLVHAAQSFVDGWQQAMWAGVAVMGALFLYITLRGPENTAPAIVDEIEATAASPSPGTGEAPARALGRVRN